MKIRSLAYQTDLIFPRYEGRVVDRGDYLVVETPTNPRFIWGNFLIFPEPPTPSDHTRWKEIFRREFAHVPSMRHMTLAWDGVDGALGAFEPFVSEGFLLEKSVVMSARKVSAPSKYHSGIIVRPLSRDEEWAAAIENQILCRLPGFDLASYRPFKQEQMERNRRMSEAGLGHWFGAFLGDRLVGDLGIYREGTLGRFQSVGTNPEFQRQGICGALVHQTAEFALKNMGIETLVMVADSEEHPARIYASVGFTATERCAGMYWYDKKLNK